MQNSSNEKQIAELFNQIQEEAIKAIWSQGANLVKNNALKLETQSLAEIVFRIPSSTVVAQKVKIWPAEGDYFCECKDKNDPCAHVVAAIVLLKNGLEKITVSENSNEGRIRYEFLEENDEVFLQRFIEYKNEKKIITESLVSLVGGMDSGRIKMQKFIANKADFGVDQIIGSSVKSKIQEKDIQNILKFLQETGNVFSENQLIDVLVGHEVKPKIIVEDLMTSLGVAGDISSEHVGGYSRENKKTLGFKVRGDLEFKVIKIYKNGLIKVKQNEKIFLTYNFLKNFSTDEKKIFQGGINYFYSDGNVQNLIENVLPRLKDIAYVQIKTKNLPEFETGVIANVLVEMQSDSYGRLILNPKIVYSKNDKNITEIDIQTKDVIIKDSYKFVKRNYDNEKKLVNDFRSVFPQNTFTNLTPEVSLRLKHKITNSEFLVNDKTNFIIHENVEFKIVKHSGNLNLQVRINDHNNGDLPENSKEINWNSVYEGFLNGSEFLKLDDGSFVKLPKNILQKYAERINSFINDKNSEIKSIQVASFVKEASDITFNDFEIPEDYANLVLQKFDDSKIDFGIIKCQLREYQKQGVMWLKRMTNGLFALLADDMGLGKTIQAMTVFHGNVLVVAPTSVVFNWVNEIKKFRPDINVHLYHGSNRKFPNVLMSANESEKQNPYVANSKSDFVHDLGRNNPCNVLVTSFGLLRQDIQILSQINWDISLIDEAQFIKNSESQVAKASYQLKAKSKIALSGTPIENKLSDLWSIFNYLSEGYLYSKTKFTDVFESKIAYGSQEALDALKAKINPFVLRRLKSDVAKDLPPKINGYLYAELSEFEKDYYDTLVATTKKEVHALLDSSKGVFQALELLLRLRQATTDTSMISSLLSSDDLGKLQNYQSSKIDVLVEKLESIIEDRHKALVFSQWTSFLDRIEIAFRKAKINFLRIDGSVSNREEIVRKFQDEDNESVLLISLKAGGTGLNLTRADHVFIMDPWWNPFAEEQAGDRAHRIGQDNTVFIHKVIAKDTIDEKIIELQEKKKNIAEAALAEAKVAASLSKDDILFLLS